MFWILLTVVISTFHTVAGEKSCPANIKDFELNPDLARDVKVALVIKSFDQGAKNRRAVLAAQGKFPEVVGSEFTRDHQRGVAAAAWQVVTGAGRSRGPSRPFLSKILADVVSSP